MADKHEPKVWIGCLGCYNAGALVGAWVDALEGEEYEPHDAYGTVVHGKAPACGRVKAEERWCMDHEDFGGLLFGECSPSEAAEVARLIAQLENGGHPVGAYAAYRDNHGAEYATVEGFEDDYNGEWSSTEEFAEDLAESIGAVNEEATWPNNYIDWERAARDLFMGDYWSADAPGGLVYVFRSS